MKGFISHGTGGSLILDLDQIRPVLDQIQSDLTIRCQCRNGLQFPIKISVTKSSAEFFLQSQILLHKFDSNTINLNKLLQYFSKYSTLLLQQLFRANLVVQNCFLVNVKIETVKIKTAKIKHTQYLHSGTFLSVFLQGR